MKASIIIILILLILSINLVSASTFSDNFDDCSVADWTLTGSWTTNNVSHYNSTNCAAYTATASLLRNASHTISSQTNFWSFEVYPTPFTASNEYIFFEKNTADTTPLTAGHTNYIQITRVGAGTNIEFRSSVPGYTTYTHTAGLSTWHRINITKSGTNVIINIKDSNDVLLNTQTLPFSSITNSNSIMFEVDSNSNSMMFDNVYASDAITTAGTAINFDQDGYFMHDTATIIWSLSSTDWTDIFYFKTIVLSWTDENSIPHETRLVSSPIQTGSYAYEFSDLGFYEVDIYKSFLGLGSPESLASDTAIVRSEAQSYIYTDSPTAFMRVPFNVHYSIGYSLEGYTSEIEIIGTNTVTGGIIEVSIIDASLGNTGTQIMQQTDVKVWPEGTYTLKLYDARKDKVLDTKTITIVNDPRLIPVLLFNTSNISTDRSTYFINDYMTVDFTVDDANFTNYTIRADVYNFNTSTTTKQFFTAFTGQTGSFETLVNSKINMQCDRGVYCWFEPGDNQIQLMRYNDTFSSVIAYQNFTVASTTVDGWGLSLSSQNVTTTETLTMKVIVPAGQTGKLQIRDPGFSPNATKIYIVDNIGEGTQTYKTTITRVGSSGKGYYEVEIIDRSNDIVKMHLPITVTRVAAPGATPSTPATQADDFLSSDMLPALIILLLFAGAGAVIGGLPGLIVGFSAGFIFGAIFDIIPTWALFLFAIVIITVFAIMMGRGFTGGGQD